MASTPLFQAEELSKEYEGGACGLRHLSLSVEQGSIYGIIGLSGAGKSTLLRAFARLVSPTRGRVLFHGEDIATLRGGALRAFRMRCGMIFQHFNLFCSRDVFSNIAYPLEIAGWEREKIVRRVDELLETVGLEKKKGNYPAALSGGEKQRVGIARALAAEPEVLFCDEATSALDPKTTREILDLLKRINRELRLTIILITHEMEVVKQICHRVAVLESGALVEEGPVAELFAAPKHPTTKRFLQTTLHEIPQHFFNHLSANCRLLRLSFRGEVAGKPIVSELIRRFAIFVNILMGWIDHLQTHVVGTLVVEVKGAEENIAAALGFLKKNGVQVEEVQGGER